MISALIQYCRNVGNLHVDHDSSPIALALGDESTDVDSKEVLLTAFFSQASPTRSVFVLPNPVDAFHATYLVVTTKTILTEDNAYPLQICLTDGSLGTVLTSFNVGDGLVMACASIRKALNILEREHRYSLASDVELYQD